MNTSKHSLFILLIAFLCLPASAFAQEEWSGVSKIVAIGDLHGDYDQYLQILNDNQIINTELKWQAGTTHLVQLGDIPDRGPDSLKIMRHLMSLAKQAKRKKGYVHTLIGNHELMNIKEDLRFVHPGEYESLVNKKSIRLQSDYVKRLFDFYVRKDPLVKENKQATIDKLKTKYPLGYVEHRFAWAPGGEIFKWVSRNNSVIKINKTIFAHGGISPHETLIPLHQINKRIRRSLRPKKTIADEDPLIHDEGPLWYRGLALNNKDTELEPLIALLKFYDADNIVVAHTPTAGAIIPRFDNRVILADVGLAKAYGNARANLVIEDGRLYTMHRGNLVPLPDSEDQIVAYLIQLSKLDPAPSSLLNTITRLSKSDTAANQ